MTKHSSNSVLSNGENNNFEQKKKRYKANKPVFNGVEQNFKYVLPTANLQTSSLLADVIIISTKSLLK